MGQHQVALAIGDGFWETLRRKALGEVHIQM